MITIILDQTLVNDDDNADSENDRRNDFNEKWNYNKKIITAYTENSWQMTI